ncbi:PREDICTED: serine/threonine-protein phosphatase 2A activator [Drosophila arizonae]|uniref:Serine/threonine-protein phosphatase 2A activator n=1 Tax=Drosophila arizonae TaxID=7263 RepID=A0ABM1PW98_DROAR|nr:PREDICTED: serine/threonine-protein phosphatase 2A activator [Drosophila arizonae]
MDEDVSRYFEKISHGAVMRVRKECDMPLWYNSMAYHDVIAYINRTSTAIQGVQQLEPHGYPVSLTMRKLCHLIDSLIMQLSSVKPHAMNSYRTWSHQMLHKVFNMLETALPATKCEYVGELGQYLGSSFGNFTRADYGTGNELSFIFFLCSLFQAGILGAEDEPAAALMLFSRYLKCVRRLQSLFDLKPSAHQGAYSLDDFQFVAYMWGVAQLCYEPPFSPRELLDEATIREWRNQYLIVGCVAFLASTKTGTFAMHSNLLWSVASLSSWTQIYTGLQNMYLKEVICQFHLLRELCFGKLMAFVPVPPASQLMRAELGHLSLARQRYLREKEKLSNEQEQQKALHHQHHRRDHKREHRREREREWKREGSSVQRLSSIIEASHSGISSGSSITSLSGTSVHMNALAKRLGKHKQEQNQNQKQKGQHMEY